MKLSLVTSEVVGEVPVAVGVDMDVDCGVVEVGCAVVSAGLQRFAGIQLRYQCQLGSASQRWNRSKCAATFLHCA